jgi:hypothetical protein
MSKINYQKQRHAIVMLYCWVLSQSCSVFLYWFVGPHIYSLYRVLFVSALSACVFLLPLLIDRLTKTWLIQLATVKIQLMQLLVLAIVAMIGWLSQSSIYYQTLGERLIILAGIAGLYYIVTIVCDRVFIKYIPWLLFWICVQCLCMSYAYFLLMESLPDMPTWLSAGVHIVASDHLFYAALIAMIKHHGLVSTGINGYHAYHLYWLTEWFMGCLMPLFNLSSLDVITWTMLIIFVPFFTCQYLLIGVRFCGIPENTKNNKFYLMLSILLFTYSSQSLSLHFGMFEIQTTYALTLALLLIFVSLVWSVIAVHISEQISYNHWSMLLLIFIAMPLVAFLASFAKISTMVVIDSLLVYAWLRFKLYKTVVWDIAAVMFFFLTYIMVLYFQPPVYKRIDFALHWYNYMKQIDSMCNFTLFDFLSHTYSYLMLAILLAIMNPRLNKLKLFQSYALVPLEVALILNLSMTLFANMWKIPHGSGIYFVNYGKQASILALCYVLYKLVIYCKEYIKTD